MIFTYLAWRFSRIKNVAKMKIFAIKDRSYNESKFLSNLVDFAIMTNVWLHKSLDHYRQRHSTEGRIRLSYLLSLFIIITFIRFNGAAFVPKTWMVDLISSPVYV